MAVSLWVHRQLCWSGLGCWLDPAGPLSCVGLGCLWSSVSLIPYLARPGWFSWQSWGPRGIVQGDCIASGTFWQPEMRTGELKRQGRGDGRSFRGQGRGQVGGCSHCAVYRPGSFLGGLMGKLQECRCVLQKLETLGFLPLFAVPEAPLGLNFCQVHISFATLPR